MARTLGPHAGTARLDAVTVRNEHGGGRGPLEPLTAMTAPMSNVTANNGYRVVDTMRVFLFAGAMTLGVIFSGLPHGANAQHPSPAQTDAVRRNCRSDYQSLCASVPPGGQASMQCLAQHAARLSPACGQSVAAIMDVGAGTSTSTAQARPVPAYGALSPPPAMSPREELMLMRQACGTDYRRLCAGVGLGGGQALSCLAAHSMSLSHACEQALLEMHAQRGAR